MYIRPMKTRYRRTFIYVFSLVLILGISQGAFFYFQNVQAQKSIVAVQTILRQEITSSNTFLIARTLSDLEKSDFLKCVRLVESKTGQEHLDLTFNKNCRHNPWLLAGKRVSVELKSLNGTQWLLDFETVNGDFFSLSLWLLRLFLGLLIVIGLAIYFHREEELMREKEKEFKKKEKLKELAVQAAHDVASPLTLFDALMDSDLMVPEAKEFLGQGIDRVRGIVGSLREQSDLIETELTMIGPVDLGIVISAIVKEKRAAFKRLSWQPPQQPVIVSAETSQLKRIISNLLNNAIEASDEMGSIEVLVNEGTQPTVRLKDKGKGIPESILPELGKRSVSFGKEAGLGLGLYHAKSYMQIWGGKLEIVSKVDEGTEVRLFFRAGETK